MKLIHTLSVLLLIFAAAFLFGCSSGGNSTCSLPAPLPQEIAITPTPDPSVTITVAPTEPTTLVDREIRGSVSAGTSPIANAAVTLFVGGARLAAITTAADGTYTFGIRPAGNYEITATTNFGSRTQLFTHTQIQDSIINFNLAKVGEINGTVRNLTTGEPVPNAVVALQQENAAKTVSEKAPTTIATTITNENGYYEFTSLSFGSYTVTSTIGNTIIETKTTEINITNPKSIVDFIIDLKGSISGKTTLFPENTPLAGIKVYLVDKDGQIAETISAEDGTYKFENLPLGPYTLYAEYIPGNYPYYFDIASTQLTPTLINSITYLIGYDHGLYE